MEKKQGVVGAVFSMKCPQCRKGDLFIKPGVFVVDGMADMHQHCPVCGLRYEQEPGFWWGAMYVSYGLAVFTSLPTFVISYALLGFTFWESFSAVVFLQLLLVPFIFRLSRSIWIYIFGNYRFQH